MTNTNVQSLDLLTEIDSQGWRILNAILNDSHTLKSIDCCMSISKVQLQSRSPVNSTEQRKTGMIYSLDLSIAGLNMVIRT